MNYITKIVKSLEKYGLLIKGVSKITENKAEKKKSFFSMLLVTFAANLLGNIFSQKT